ncbi:ubiquinone anaerobic biosynthesis accessory factor UbiT [Tahibacter amnicola]|uniref:chorismate mutase n=1 Tax=Tahibacter amnicola TaxID=2976241 RepID=A0ABY6BRU5_9GAMM|nr:SCP2 sterol-binding domain-containing protein [Tahibacter amnicola]UXI70482.1 SCP2 sterol-binding domain-containing protein [Tahibacter amnicola]
MTAAAQLAALRGLITGIDDGLIILMGVRCRVVAAVAALKQREGWAVRDPLRERRVLRRALRLGKACGVPALQAGRHSRMLMRAACRQQRRTQAACAVSPNRIEKARDTMISRLPFRSLATDLLGLLPPPKRLAPVLAAIPSHWRAQWLERAVGQIVGGGDDEWAFLQGRRIGIEITDLNLRWVIAYGECQARVVDAPADASVHATAVDLLLLASRLEDADTLFFQRRLRLTGDIELGLTLRNRLDSLPWESIPLAIRILLNRGARAARRARDSHHKLRHLRLCVATEIAAKSIRQRRADEP